MAYTPKSNNIVKIITNILRKISTGAKASRRVAIAQGSSTIRHMQREGNTNNARGEDEGSTHRRSRRRRDGLC